MGSQSQKNSLYFPPNISNQNPVLHKFIFMKNHSAMHQENIELPLIFNWLKGPYYWDLKLSVPWIRRSCHLRCDTCLFYHKWQNALLKYWHPLLSIKLHGLTFSQRVVFTLCATGSNPEPDKYATIFGSVSSSLCAWKLERVCSQTQLCQLICV